MPGQPLLTEDDVRILVTGTLDGRRDLLDAERGRPVTGLTVRAGEANARRVRLTVDGSPPDLTDATIWWQAIHRRTGTGLTGQGIGGETVVELLLTIPAEAEPGLWSLSIHVTDGDDDLTWPTTEHRRLPDLIIEEARSG